MVYATSKSATLSFEPWKQLLIGYIISSTTFVLVCGLILVENFKKRKYLNTQ
jgi:hypothetical protein